MEEKPPLKLEEQSKRLNWSTVKRKWRGEETRERERGRRSREREILRLVPSGFHSIFTTYIGV